jgi:predicted Rossmann fold nucleotide-binding protein DprA/Smf involved in DNA uptake
LAKASTKPACAPKASARLSQADQERECRSWTFRALLNEFGGAEAAIDALPALSRRGGRIHDICLCSEEDAAAELAVAESLGASLVAIGEPGYPPALAQVDAPPPLLCVKGRLDLPDIPIVAIVGARNGSAVGQKFTRALATDLGQECHRLWTNNLLKQGRVPCDISARHRRDVGANPRQAASSSCCRARLRG